MPELTKLEVLAGSVFGPDPEAPSFPQSGGSSARVALEEQLRPALARQPCCVAFSGGRDSSAILALATHVARRDGLPEPIPLTMRFVDAPDTEESSWQEQVIGHLGLAHWERLTIDDEYDLVGPVAADVLRRHGLLYPAMVHSFVPSLQVASGGSLVTGEGGDGVFDRPRSAVLYGLRRRLPRPPRVDDLGRIGFGLAPKRFRAFAMRRQFATADGFGWLRPAPRMAVARRFAAEMGSEPLGWAQRLEWMSGRRFVREAFRNADMLAAEQDVQRVDPLLRPAVMAALGADGGTVGWPGRTAAYRFLFGDLLPASVLERRSKAVFTTPYVNRHARDFAVHWDGTGVDPALVDVAELRREWLSAEAEAGTFLLLQAAWISSGMLGGTRATTCSTRSTDD